MKTISRLITLSILLLVAGTAWLLSTYSVPPMPQMVLTIVVTWVVSAYVTTMVIWGVAKKLMKMGLATLGGVAKSVTSLGG